MNYNYDFILFYGYHLGDVHKIQEIFNKNANAIIANV